MTQSPPVIPLTTMTPYLGRFVVFHYYKNGKIVSERGFLCEIASNEFVLDNGLMSVPQKGVVSVYNITGELIAGQEI